MKIIARSKYRFTWEVPACSVFLLLFLAGCAPQRGREAFYYDRTYVPAGEFSRRVSKTEISSLSSEALLKEGYVPIGRVTVKHQVGESFKNDTTTEAQILAAQRGGDLLKLDADREEREETREKRGRCLETRKQVVLSWTPESPRDEWKEVSECVSWEKIPIKTRVIVSMGTAWRREPEFLGKNAALVLADAIQDNETALSEALLNTLEFDVNVTDRFGWTPLMYAAFQGGEGNVGVARILLDRGAEVNLSDREGKTALMKAVINGHADMALFLLERGANAAARDRAGRTALDYAQGALRENMEKWLKDSSRE